MNPEREYRPLHTDEIDVLQQQGCTAQVWSDIWGTPDFSPDNIHDARFVGTVRLGRLTGKVRGTAGQIRPAGIYRATLNNCTVGDDVRISQVRSQVANYDIGDGASIDDVGLLLAHPNAIFGNGVRVQAVNEGGGREATLFNELSAQFAYLQVAHRGQRRARDGQTCRTQLRPHRRPRYRDDDRTEPCRERFHRNGGSGGSLKSGLRI
jgi:hypothetical protein